MFCLNSLLLTKKNIVTTPVTKASDSPNHGLIKYILLTSNINELYCQYKITYKCR